MGAPGSSPTLRRRGTSRPGRRTSGSPALAAAGPPELGAGLPPPLPEVPVGRLQENISKARFELALPEQLVTRWQDNDFGIDAMVELTYFSQRPPRFVASGKKFSAQIKSRSAPATRSGNLTVSIEVGKILYWLSCSEPVMLVRHEPVSDELRFVWIDDGFAAALTNRRPGWRAARTVTIQFGPGARLVPSRQAEILGYVLRWRPPGRQPMAPAQFFALRQQVGQLTKSLALIADSVGVATLSAPVIELANRVALSAYTIAITGPSRAGKSTLINALVRREISPVNVLPTTGLPVVIVGGPTASATVRFKSGPAKDVQPSAAGLAPYVTQQENGGNVKGVKLVEVILPDPGLMNGVSFVDIPGLDDADPAVGAAAATVVSSANAIIYVIDASPFENGGFSLNVHHVRDLKRISASADRVFLLLNKADGLSPDKHAPLMDYVNGELVRFDLRSSLPNAPHLLSAREAWAARTSTDGPPDPLAPFESELWGFILGNNKAGIYLLRAAADEVARRIPEAIRVVGDEIAQAHTRADLEAARVAGVSSYGRLAPELIRMRDEAWWALDRQLATSKQAILGRLTGVIGATPVGGQLPSPEQVRAYLETHTVAALAQAGSDVSSSLARIQWSAAGFVEQAFSRPAVQRTAGVVQPAVPVDLSPASLPIPEDMSSPIMAAALGGLAGLALGPLGLIAGLVVGFFTGLFVSADTRHRRRSSALLANATVAMDQSFAEIRNGLWRVLSQGSDRIQRWADDRANSFASDLQRRAALVGNPVPIERQRALALAQTELPALLVTANAQVAELEQFVF
jgi:hypothetical protein